MAEHCSQECEETGPVCDFCLYYDFDRMHCDLTGETKLPHEGCDEFVCSMTEKTNDY